MDLNDYRIKIDELDEKLLRLFVERMDIAAEIAEYKRANNMPVLNKNREREILARVSEQAGPKLAGYSRTMFSGLFNLSRAYQKSLLLSDSPLINEIEKALAAAPKAFPETGTVACQGVEGAYSQIACDKMFRYPNIVYMKTFEGVFQAVAQGMCEFGILPIENSSYGSVNAVYDLMKDYKFHITRSMKLKVDHVLLAPAGTRLEDIREIHSHEQALGQCSNFFKKHSGITVHVCENTAVAAQRVAESGRNDVAAISSRQCAELYGLNIIADGFQNSDHNYTRFICITKEMRVYPGADRISMMLTMPHEPGSLYSAISKFAALGLNLTKLESRPITGSDFEFMFYFDFEASLTNDEVTKLLGELSAGPEFFMFLGNYSEV